jgi:CBS domain-containing protein
MAMPSPDAQRSSVRDAGGMPELGNQFPALAHVRVRDCMHHEVLSCSAEDSVQDIAVIMANHRVHAVMITSGNGERPIGVVSDLDVVAAVAAGARCTAHEVAATETLTVSGDEPVQAAARLMNEHGVSHLVVVDAAGGYPVGVLSSLDIAAAYANS